MNKSLMSSNCTKRDSLILELEVAVKLTAVKWMVISVETFKLNVAFICELLEGMLPSEGGTCVQRHLVMCDMQEWHQGCRQ